MNIYDFLKNKNIFNDLKTGKVIDIGGGDGREGEPFKQNGFDVVLIDLKNGIDATKYDYPKEEFNIAIANNSLPFMKDEQFSVMLNTYKTLKNGGYFYGTVFGNEEPWIKDGFVTPLDFNDTLTFLQNTGFKILWQSEEKGIGKTMKGDSKNWHILKFLVQK